MRGSNGRGRRRAAAALALVLLWLPAGGCSQPTGTVSGTVTYQKKPLPGGFITFNNLAPDGRVLHTKSVGIAADGSYTVSGLSVGPAKITVQGPPGEIVTAAQPGGKGMQFPSRSKPTIVLPPQYGTVEQTPLEYTVTAGNQTYNPDLE